MVSDEIINALQELADSEADMDAGVVHIPFGAALVCLDAIAEIKRLRKALEDHIQQRDTACGQPH